MLEDPAPRRPLSFGEKVAVGVCAGVFSVLLLADLAVGFSPSKLGFLFMLLAWVPALVLHELGHLAAARLVGWHVSEMVIGYGPDLLRFRWGETAVRVKAVLVEGYVVPAPVGSRYNRLKAAWIYFAGPGIELLFAALLLMLSDAPFGQAQELGDVVAQGFAGSLLLGVAFTLFPYSPASGQASDGLGIFLSLFRRTEDFEEQGRYPLLVACRRALLLEQLEEAAQVLVQAKRRHPEDVRFLALEAVLMAWRGGLDAAFALLAEVGPPERHQPQVEAELLHCAALVVLVSDDQTEPLVEAEQACGRALSVLGEDPTVRTTLGAVYLARRRNRQALEVLMLAFKSARRREDELRALAYLVIAARRCGEKELAAGYGHALALEELGPALRRRVAESAAGSPP